MALDAHEHSSKGSEKPEEREKQAETAPEIERRDFLSSASTLAMAGGLVASYGAFAGVAAKYLYPAGDAKTTWLYVALVTKLKKGEAMPYKLPSGAEISIARQGDSGEVGDFIALSSVCPHLGCRVHWQALENRFFCPCHNGIFDASGKGTGGPPGDAKQVLSEYPLRIEKGLLYIESPVT